ncbi:MAG: hypothetical protein NPIRA03_01470 [Nitrospirales bacterium]|nr:MAG: hypothetical protein NPIRA03_01470 [Nitrospirales bacterium]
MEKLVLQNYRTNQGFWGYADENSKRIVLFFVVSGGHRVFRKFGKPEGIQSTKKRKRFLNV